MSKDELQQLLSQPLVVLDTETTGFYFDNGDEIIELAAEKVINGEVVDTFHSLIRPSIPIPLEAQAVHGLGDAFVHANGAWPHEVFPKFSDFAEGTVLVGHNIRRFDFPFLQSHYRRLDLPLLENNVLDTLELSRAMLRLPNHKLGTIAAHFQISTAGAHRAMADVVMTRQVLFKLSGT